MTPIEKIARIKSLREEADRLDREVKLAQANCQQHVWGEPVRDDIEEDTYRCVGYQGVGSDPEPIMEKVGVKRTPLWRKTCRLCGLTRTTTKTKATSVAPDFS